MCVVYRDEVGSADASHSRGMKQIKLHGYVNSECDWGDQDTVPNIEKMLHIVGYTSKASVFEQLWKKRQ